MLPVQKDDFDVDVLAVLVQEVLEEVGHGLVRDVSAHHDVPAGSTERKLLATAVSELRHMSSSY
jgi:hypothetical protein